MPGLLDGFMDDPSTMGLLGMAGGLLSAGGPSLTPHTLGQGLSAGLAGMSAGYNGVKARLQDQQANEQNMQMNDLKIDGMKQQQMQAQAMLALQNRIKQRLGSDPQAMPSMAPTGSPLQDTPASAMPGGPMSPKIGGPDWMQAYQQSQPQQPMAPQMAPQAPAQPQGMANDALGPQVAGQLLREAKIRQEEGDYDGANKLYEQATKYMPKFATDFRQAVGPDGKLRNYQLADNGQIKEVGLGVKPEMTEVDLGGTKQFVDKNSVLPNQSFKRTQTPDSVASNSLGYARLNFDKAQAAAPDKGADPAQVESMAQMIASGRAPTLGAMAMRTPYGQAVMARVNDLNPNFRAQDYGTGAKTEKDFATGKQGNSVRSFNVAISHLDTLDQLADGLKNGNMQIVNKLANGYATQTGNAAPTSFEAAKKVVADEVVKAIVGSGGGVHDREEAAKTISQASSPAQLKGVIKTYKELMVGQLGGLEQQYRVASGRDDFNKYLSGPAQQMFHPTGQASAGGGKTVSLSDIQATATASGKSTKEVTDALKAKGYTIGGM